MQEQPVIFFGEAGTKKSFVIKVLAFIKSKLSSIQNNFKINFLLHWISLDAIDD